MLVALGTWVAVSAVVGLLLGRIASLMKSSHEELQVAEPAPADFGDDLTFCGT